MTCNNIPVLNLCDVKKGATFSQIFTFTTEDVSTGAETNRDFTNVTAAQMVIKEKLSSSTSVLSLSLGSGLTLNTDSAQLTITITSTQTGAVTVSTGVYDIFFTYSDGTVEPMLEGKVTFRSGTI